MRARSTVCSSGRSNSSDGIHPIYHKRCERDGLDFETMGLGEEDLELDDGTPVPIEQPTEIKTPPLSEKDQDDRVRMAFGLTHDDPLPEISLETQPSQRVKLYILSALLGS